MVVYTQANVCTAIPGLAMLAFSCFLRAAEPQPIFVQVERTKAIYRRDTSCKSGVQGAFTTSQLNVLETREIVYELVEHAICQGDYVRPFDLHWFDTRDKREVFRTSLSVADFQRFSGYLDSDEVKGICGLYPNAGPGVGDFEIEITRHSGVQKIGVISLSPRRVQNSPREIPLVLLICKAKDIAHRASKSAMVPDWCSSLPPLKGPIPGMKMLKPPVAQ